jgi:hypothetical protein
MLSSHSPSQHTLRHPPRIIRRTSSTKASTTTAPTSILSICKVFSTLRHGCCPRISKPIRRLSIQYGIPVVPKQPVYELHSTVFFLAFASVYSHFLRYQRSLSFSIRFFLCYIRPQKSEGHPYWALNSEHLLVNGSSQPWILLPWILRPFNMGSWPRLWARKEENNHRLKLNPGLSPCSASSRSAQPCLFASVVCLARAEIPKSFIPKFLSLRKSRCF